ncbi:MAG: hypothetical protein IPM97_12265 [Bdellovibrionaceae bacterium]|nr:hypothetical protein [Pseudobdellovibrionaceae bacterium]
MRRSVFYCLFAVLLVSSLAQAKWIDPEAEALKNRKFKVWNGVDFTFTGFASSSGMKLISYHAAINDFWEWDAGAGIDSLGWFVSGGGRYFMYNWPRTTCFFAFPCHGQVSGGMNLNYANGGRKTYTDGAVETKYDQSSSMSMWPTIAFRSIYQDFFSLSLDVGYRLMVQKPSITRGYGPPLQSAVDDMEKGNKDGFGASISVGIVF